MKTLVTVHFKIVKIFETYLNVIYVQFNNIC